MPFILTVPEVAPGLPQGLADFFIRLVIPKPEIDAAAIVHETIETPTGRDHVPLIFDIDAFAVAELDPKSDEISERLEQLRDFKNEAFSRESDRKVPGVVPMNYAAAFPRGDSRWGGTAVSSPAIGADAAIVRSAAEATETNWRLLLVQDELDVARRFRRLSTDWRESTQWLSSIHAMMANPTYLEIVGMGRPALPLILAELRREPGHWFPALLAISGENPVDEPDAGNVRRMADAWLRWGRTRGLVW